MKIFDDVISAIGNTPLVRIRCDCPAIVCAKLEYLNPGGSFKDRSASFMIEEAERKGILKSGSTLIDASSGNQGIATAMIGAAKGYKVIITVSTKVSPEKLATLKAYGAHVVICPATDYLEDPRSYHSQALKIHQETPDSFMPNQYFNVSNRLAHQTLLAPEIWEQTDGKITHFFAAAGTGGSVSGVGRFLKSKNPAIKVIAIDSATSWKMTNGHPKPYKVEGIGIDFESPVIDYGVIDEVVGVTDEDALGMLPKLARGQGLLVGPSSGAVAWVVAQFAPRLKEGDLAVAIFGDSGRAYLSKGFYEK